MWLLDSLACIFIDIFFIAKLAVKDTIALETKYHVQCLVALYNHRRQSSISNLADSQDRCREGIAVAAQAGVLY